MCVVWQHLTYKTKRKTPQATSVEKRRKNGAILFGWGDSLLRDMLDAGVFDCLNGEFGDIEVSLRYCVPSVWLTFVTNSVDQPLRGPVSVSNLGRTEARKGRASAQASRREGCRPRGRGLLLGSAELPAARRLYSGCCRDLCSAAWVSDSPVLNELIFVLQAATHKEAVPNCRVWSLAAASCREGQEAASCCCGEGVCARAKERARVPDSVAPVRRRGVPRRRSQGCFALYICRCERDIRYNSQTEHTCTFEMNKLHRPSFLWY